MDFDKKIAELFLDLPEAPPATGSYVNAIQTGKLVFVSGVLPWKDGRMLNKGRVGLEINADAGRQASHAACMLALGILRSFLGGSLNKVRQVVSMRGFVASGADFHDHHKVLDGASQLIFDVFGNKPVRTAVGVTSLPFNAAVELELVFELK